MSVTIDLWGSGNTDFDVVMGPPPPPDLSVVRVEAPINLAPGYVVQTTRSFVAVNGGPSFEAASTVTLDDEGYYEIDVGDEDGLATRHPVCIVDAAALTAAIESPAAIQTTAFKRLAEVLAPAYPRGKVVPLVQDRSQALDAHVDRAVLLEVRARTLGGTYSAIANVLARGAGTWRSGAFNVPRGQIDLRLAVVISPSDTVLS